MNTTMTLDVKEQINDKIKTFTRWNYRQATKKKKKDEGFKLGREQTNEQNMINALLAFTENLKKDNDKNKKTKKTIKIE